MEKSELSKLVISNSARVTYVWHFQPRLVIFPCRTHYRASFCKLSSDQLRAALLIGRNAVAWTSALSNVGRLWRHNFPTCQCRTIVTSQSSDMIHVRPGIELVTSRSQVRRPNFVIDPSEVHLRLANIKEYIRLLARTAFQIGFSGISADYYASR